MASINKLSIRGIRAFSPEDTEQFVDFYFPFTVIVGANGCGKTTIIECLKYAVTGGFPPGVRSGQAFVHDAKSVGQTTVKANVKLRFTSRAGQTMVAVRSMETTQRKASLTFKQLDGVIRTMDPDTGERVSLSHKCSELDKQIPQLLGVTAPILEHVIFCHQEDSSWPLQEGAVLKKKFDEIFDSTRYTKALDVFRKTEKELLSRGKDLKVDLEGLKSHKYAAEQFRKDLAHQNEQIDGVDEVKQEIQQAFTTLKKDMEKYQEIIRQLDDFENLVESRRNELAQEHLLVKKQTAMLESDLTLKYKQAELKDMLRRYDDEVTDKLVQEKEQMERTVKNLLSEIDNFRSEEMALTGDIGRYRAEKDAHEQRLRTRYHQMETIATTYSVELNLTQSSQLQQSLTQETTTVSSPTSSPSSPGLSSQGGCDDLVMSISSADMDAFFLELERKGKKLKDGLAHHHEHYQNEIDSIQGALTDIGGKLKSIENDRSKLADEKNDLSRELNDISSQALGHSRLRRADIDDTRRKADEAAKKRDEENMNPRKLDIPNEIRLAEQKMDAIKRQLEDDKLTLDNLRHSADSQNEIAVLKDQCEKDLDVLEDACREQSYSLQKFNVSLPRCRLENDENGDEMISTMEGVHKDVQTKYDDCEAKVSRATTDRSKTQHILSEKKALLAASQRTLASHKTKVQGLGQSVATVEKAIQDLRRFEASKGNTMAVDLENPKELLQYVETRLEELEENNEIITNMPKVVKKFVKQLKKMSRLTDEKGVQIGSRCPCCTRDLKEMSDMETFIKAVNELADEIINKNSTQESEQYGENKSTYTSFRKMLMHRMSDLQDYRRLNEEMGDVEKEAKVLQNDTELFESTYKEQMGKENDLLPESTELRELLETTRRWVDEANRIAEKRIRVNQKSLDLTASIVDTSRDLRTVERDMNALMEDKDALANKINRLNKEMTQVNNAITHLSVQAANLDKLARDKETKFASEQKAIERKSEIMKRLEQLGDDEKKLLELIGPLKTKIRAKETERTRVRSAGNDEERTLQSQLSQFDNDVKQLRTLVQQIVAFSESSKSDELERLTGSINKIVEKINTRKKHLDEMQPKLETIRSAVVDQERHKKNLKQNIDILQAKTRMAALEQEITKYENECRKIDGRETAYEDYENTKKQVEKLNQDQARHDGRYSEIAESIRSLKRKLSQQEYKDVDEEYRIATIKHTTTLIAADDLKKYAIALDKALLQFHSVKITEINKRIRELWLLTYKGEDITNIEIVSGQEAGLKAQKSYNYRVVMTKGNAQMDMRGRCSAGQRVLASIVIRLALAETFGLNCGCIALDEPTANLDDENKRGLCIALAQIITSRSVQRNFQLILITHDEEFVSWMKTELSAQSSVSMPEKYFQVSREMSNDGKFYSKIHAKDWDELV